MAGDFGGNQRAQFGKAVAFGDGVQEIRRLTHGRRCLTGGWGEQTVFHMAIGVNQHHKRAVGRQADKFDMLDRRFLLGRKNKAGGAGDARQGCAHLIQQGRDIAIIAVHRGFNLGTILIVDCADLHKPIHKHPQAKLGGDTASGDMGAIKKAQKL